MIFTRKTAQEKRQEKTGRFLLAHIVIVLGFLFFFSGEKALGELKEGKDFQVALNENEIVEEAIIVSELPQTRKKEEGKKYILKSEDKKEQQAKIIFLREAPRRYAAEKEHKESLLFPQEKSFGEKISEKIDAKIAEERKRQEIERRQKERKQEESILRKIDIALSQKEETNKEPQWVKQDLKEPQRIKQDVKEPQWVKQDLVEEALESKKAHTTLVEQEKSVREHFEEEEERKSRISIAPLIGISSIDSSNRSDYEIDSATSFGVNLDFSIDESLFTSFSYLYAEYEIPYYRGNGRNQYNNLGYKQNSFNIGIKYKLFTQDFGIRPTLIAGIGYVRGYVNYNSDKDAYGYQSYGLEDYVVSSFTGYIGGGMEFRFSKKLAIATAFRYNNILHNDKDKYGFRTASGNRNDLGSLDRRKESVGREIQDNAYYSISASLLLQF